MAEETMPANHQKKENAPGNILTGALKMVRGENKSNPTKLMEEFTAEMTLVAEGLCEDQSRLRRDIDRMISEDDRRIQKADSRIDMLEQALDEEKEAHDRELTEMRNRLAALEKKAAREGKDKKKSRTVIRDLTWLVGIAAGAWIIVTVIQKFF